MKGANKSRFSFVKRLKKGKGTIQYLGLKEIKSKTSTELTILQKGGWPGAEWMDAYLRLGRRYVTDYELLADADHETDGKSRAELQAGIGVLDELYASLLTRGRARYNVKVWQNDFRLRLRYLRTRKVEDQWSALCEKVEGSYFTDGQFAAGSRELQKIELKEGLERRQRAALLFFCKEAEGFIGELGRMLGPGVEGVELKTRRGSSYTRIIGSQEGGLMG